MIVQEGPSLWNKKTRQHIPKYIDEFISNSLQEGVRKATQALVFSLFKKGNSSDKTFLLTKIAEKLTTTQIGGKTSQQLLTLINSILKLKDPLVTANQNKILDLYSKKMISTVSILLCSPNFNYFTFCENILVNQGVFKPYLYELNGCLKCYGTTQNKMTTSQKPISQIVQETKYNGNKIQFYLKRIYSIKQFSIKLPSRQLPITVFVNDSNNVLTKQGVINPLNPFEFTTNFIQLEIDNVRVGKCMACGKNDESSVFCLVCRKSFDVQCKYKTVGGSTQKIMKQLGPVYKQISQIRRKYFSFYESITMKKTISNFPVNISETEKIYMKIMSNLNLLQLTDKKSLHNYRLNQGGLSCYSCIYYQVKNLLLFLKDTQLLTQLFSSNQGFVITIYDFLTKIYTTHELPIFIGSTISQILGVIKFLIYEKNKTSQSIGLLEKDNFHRTFNIFKSFFLLMKKTDQIIGQRLIFEYTQGKELTIQQKVSLATILVISKDDLNLIKDDNIYSSEQYKNIQKIQGQKAKEILEKLKLDSFSFLKLPASNEIILLLKYLPNEYITVANSDSTHASLIPYIVNKSPVFSKQLPIVYSPYPILCLNAFENLPLIAEKLSSQQCAQLLQQIIKFKDHWNFNLYSVLDTCNSSLEKQDKQKQLIIYLKGLSIVNDNYFLDKIASFLIPKRKQFTIRVQLPEKDIKNQYKKYGDELEYPVINQREIRTENLPNNGQTMKQVYDWIMSQMKEKMPFDLIVEDKIVDQLNTPIEMIHKKLYPPVEGKPPVEIIKVIYRVRGVFIDQGNEDKLVTLGDDQLEETLNFTPLLTRQLFSDNPTLCGLDTLFKIFKGLKHKPQMLSVRKLILKMFKHIFRSESVRIKAIERNYVDNLIRQTLAFLALKDEQFLNQKQILLQLVSKLIDQASSVLQVNIRKASLNDRKGSQMMDIEDDRAYQTAHKNINLLLQKIVQYQNVGKTKDINYLIKLLPFSSKDIQDITQKLFNYFSPVETYQSKNKQKIQKLITFMQALPKSYVSFKNLCYERKLLQSVLKSFSQVIPNIDNITDQVIIQNQGRLLLDLRILKITAQNCQPLQKQIVNMKLTPIFHKLSVTSTQANKVITAAQQLVSGLTNKDYVIQQLSEQAQSLITSHLEQKRKKAKATKNARLQMERKKRDLAAQNAFKNVAVVTQDTKKYQHLKCIVCKSGYQSGNSMIGIYVYLNRCEILSIDKWWADPKRINSTTGVTFFTVIHFQCHRNAQVYDNEKKINEWQGAQKRNADSKCNSWIPIRGPNNTDDQFEKSSRKYFDANKGNGFWVSLNDLRGLLMKFGNQENFAKDSKGSSLSNSKLICSLIAFTSSFAKKADNFKQAMQGFWSLKTKDIQSSQVMSLYLTSIIFNITLKDFQQFKKLTYNKIITFTSKQQNFNAARPYLIILGIIKQIYRLIHSKIDASKDICVGIEEYISKNLNIIEQFQSLSDAYRNILTKKETIEELEAQLFK